MAAVLETRRIGSVSSQDICYAEEILFLKQWLTNCAEISHLEIYTYSESTEWNELIGNINRNEIYIRTMSKWLNVDSVIKWIMSLSNNER